MDSVEKPMPTSPTILPTSFVTFSTPDKVIAPGDPPDEMFLLYTKGTEEGRARGIHRDGIGSPWMWDEDARRRVTDPDEQRRGTWLMDRTIALDIEKKAIEHKRKSCDVRTWAEECFHKDPDAIFDEWLRELEDTPDYLSQFDEVYKPQGYRIVGMQGCGNLTMNSWFVAYCKSDFTDCIPTFLYRRDEPFQERIYTCLIKDRDTRRLSIDPVRFNIYKRRIYKVMDGADVDITETAEFAIFGQQLVKNGQLVDSRTVVTQFEDIRHLFKLANINPDIELLTARHKKRPRMLFGDDRNDDVWFGERELTHTGKEDLLRHALTEPILLDREFEVMGAGWDLIRSAFSASTGGGYRELVGGEASYPPRNRGEWRRYTDRLIEIYLQRNVYAYSMVGLDSRGNVVAAAAGGKAGRVGHTLEAMAQNMVSVGAKDVLLIDEGNDVFQRLEKDYVVPPLRGRIRAVLIWAQRTKPETDAVGAG